VKCVQQCVYPRRIWRATFCLTGHVANREQRVQFANDISELLAVSGPLNVAKGDAGPGRWPPPNRAFDCQYVQIYVGVAVKYGLPITTADRDASASACS
jgi:hypothetical protein